jgi:hypothetical protein
VCHSRGKDRRMRAGSAKPIYRPALSQALLCKLVYQSQSLKAVASFRRKVVQTRHSGRSMMLDTYGHLFPRGEDHAELEEVVTIWPTPWPALW